MCQHDTSTEHSKQSAAPAPNHPSEHTAAENAKTAKGTAMSSIYEIEKQIEAISKLVRELCELVGVEVPAEDLPADAG
jgi:hypothetical protein